jgi:hypothetical protein
MAYFLKSLGLSEEGGLPEVWWEQRPEIVTGVFFSSNPKAIRPGDRLIYYAVGGRKRVVAEAEVTGQASQDFQPPPQWTPERHARFSWWMPVRLLAKCAANSRAPRFEDFHDARVGQGSYQRLTDEQGQRMSQAIRRAAEWVTPDWMKFFVQTIDAIHEPLAVVLTASGCREGWLQGELYRAGRDYDLGVNEYSLGSRQTADLSCGDDPDMLAEIKIVGADYYPKMRGYIESDVERMRAVSTAGTQRFMILIIPHSNAKTNLGEWLTTCSFSRTCAEREWPSFRLRIWQF